VSVCVVCVGVCGCVGVGAVLCACGCVSAALCVVAYLVEEIFERSYSICWERGGVCLYLLQEKYLK
jgi:hypothetical protein